MNVCRICSAPASNKCSACGIARYCSAAHQREDWPRHKADCKTLRSLREDEEGSNSGKKVFEAGLYKQVNLASDTESLHPRDTCCGGVELLRSMSLQALVEHAERCTECVPTSEGEFLRFSYSLSNAIFHTAAKGSNSALASYARSRLFRHVMFVATMPCRPPAAASCIARSLPVMFARVEAFGSLLTTTPALELCVRVCTLALDFEQPSLGLFGLWQLGPITEAIDLVALDLLPRIVTFAALTGVGRASPHNSLWAARFQARTVLKDLMVEPSLKTVTLSALRAQFASRPRFRTAAEAIVGAGGLSVFCDALNEHSVYVGDEFIESGLQDVDASNNVDGGVIIALMAFAACDNPVWTARILAAAAASGESTQARNLLEYLEMPAPVPAGRAVGSSN